MKSFDEIYIINKIEDDYKAGEISKEEAIKSLRKIWGQLGYSVDNENTEIYLDAL